MSHPPSNAQGPMAGRARTRCAELPPLLAAVVLLLLALALGASIRTVPGVLAHDAERAAAPKPETTDVDLFRRIAAQVRAGRDYYPVAIAVQRDGHYPVRPFFTVRLPTLTWLIAALSPLGAQTLILLLVAVTVKAWSGRLIYVAAPARWQTTAKLALIVVGAAPATTASGFWFSDIWAGLLIALSLALYRPQRWWPSVLVALLAVLIRELALPYLLIMGLMAALDGRRGEAIGWAVAVAAFGVAFTCHAVAVMALTHAGDLASPGWHGHGGWTLMVSACRELTMLAALPTVAVAVLLPLSFFGMAAWTSSVALRTFATLGGYTLVIGFFARPDNNYWVWFISPLLLLGLPFAPFAIADLVRSLRPRAGTINGRATDLQR